MRQVPTLGQLRERQCWIWLHCNRSPACITCRYAFDILYLNGKDLRDRPLIERARRLAKLLARSTVPVLHLVPSFPDGAAPLRSCEELKLEGIVSKRADRPYRAGPSRDWLKFKCSGWKAANQERWRMYQSSLSSDKS